MGRFVDLCGEIAAEADEGPEGLILGPEVWERLRESWQDQDIEDALSLVKDSLLQSELVEAADSLSSHLVELLGVFGEATAFRRAEAGEARMSLELIDQIARRVDRLEEVLEVFRDGRPPDRRGFDTLRGRLLDVGIEDAMRPADFSGGNDKEQPEDEE